MPVRHGTSRPVQKTPTGVAGLDEIMSGGVRSGRATVVCGGPGCGKTVRGMEFLVNSAIQPYVEHVRVERSEIEETGSYDLGGLCTCRAGPPARVRCFMPDVIDRNPSPAKDGYVLKLHVTDASPWSRRATRNLNEICDNSLPDQYDLEVKDLYKFPYTARRADIIAAPTLVKEMPAPLRPLIGDLSQKDRVHPLLNLKKK